MLLKTEPNAFSAWTLINVGRLGDRGYYFLFCHNISPLFIYWLFIINFKNYVDNKNC